MMRIALFLLTNLAVMVVFGLVLSLTGIQSSSVQGLMIMALLFGFGGSLRFASDVQMDGITICWRGRSSNRVTKGNVGWLIL